MGWKWPALIIIVLVVFSFLFALYWSRRGRKWRFHLRGEGYLKIPRKSYRGKIISYYPGSVIMEIEGKIEVILIANVNECETILRLVKENKYEIILHTALIRSGIIPEWKIVLIELNPKK